MTDTYGKYASRPIVLGFSKDQTSVDWPELAKHPQIFGGICRLGSVDNVFNAQTLESDAWMDPTFDNNVTGLYNDKLWIGAEIDLDPGWFTSRGISMDGVRAIFKGTDNEIANNLLYEPHIYLYIRKVKNGSGRIFTADKIKTLTEKPIDAVVINYQRYWLTNSNTVYDAHSGLAIQTLVDGLRWLMAKGYIKTRKILVRTSSWFLTNYSPIYGQNTVDANSTVCVGNLWDNKTAYDTTIEGIVEKMKLVPDSTDLPYVGNDVQFLNISENYFKIPEISGFVSLSVFNGTLEKMKNDYPSWTARSGSVVVVTPPPVVPPVPVTKKYFIPTVTNLNMRSAPTTATTTNKVGTAVINGVNEILEEKDADGQHWVKVKTWMATDGFGKIVSK
jgi:hypothetical protein